MTSYYVGQMIRVTNVFTGDTGQPVDPTTVYFQTRAPSGAVQVHEYPPSGVITHTGLGAYEAKVLFTESGRWLVKWVGVGALYSATRDIPLDVNETVFAYPPE